MIYYLLLLVVQVLFGINFVASKVVVTHWSPFAFACWRFLLSGLIILIFLKLTGKSIALERQYWKRLAFLALTGFSFSQSFFLHGLSLTTSTNTALIGSTIPLFIFLINRIRGQGTWSKRKVTGLLLSFIGVLVLRKFENFSLSDQTLVGDLFILFACFFLSLMISLSGDFFKKVDPMVGSAHMFCLGGIFLLPLWLTSSPMLPIDVPTIFYPSLSFSIIGATCLTYLFNNIALKKVDSDVVGLFIFLQPVVAAVVAYFAFDQIITQRSVIAFFMILAGVLLVVKSKKVSL
jgi:drug/metabolite transporter (DMT)-like permease